MPRLSLPHPLSDLAQTPDWRPCPAEPRGSAIIQATKIMSAEDTAPRRLQSLASDDRGEEQERRSPTSRRHCPPPPAFCTPRRPGPPPPTPPTPCASNWPTR